MNYFVAAVLISALSLEALVYVSISLNIEQHFISLIAYFKFSRIELYASEIFDTTEHSRTFVCDDVRWSFHILLYSLLLCKFSWFCSTSMCRARTHTHFSSPIYICHIWKCNFSLSKFIMLTMTSYSLEIYYWILSVKCQIINSRVTYPVIIVSL